MIDTIKSFFGNIKSRWTARNIHVSEWWAGLTASWSKASYLNVAKVTLSNPYASRGLRLIGQLMASVPLVVERGDDIDDDHELLSLLRRPNPRQTYRRFIDTIVTHLYCAGEVYLEARAPTTGPNAGKPARLHLWRPDRFTAFVYNDAKAPAGFLERLRPETRRLIGPGEIIGYEMRLNGKAHYFTIDEMLQIRVYNPEDEDRGLPIILGAHRAMQTMEAVDDWNKSIATGGGRVPGYWVPQGLATGQQLTRDQVEEAEGNLDRRMKDRRKSNLGMVLSGSFDWKPGAVSPREADWLKGDQNNARKVAAVIGISATLLGDEKTGSLTDAGVNSEVRAALLLTVLPLVDYVTEELNEWLAPRYGQGVRLAYNDDGIDALREDVNMAFDRYVKATGNKALVTVNEAREELGYEPIPDPRFDELVGEVPETLEGEPGDDSDDDDNPQPEQFRSLPPTDYNTLLALVAGDQTKIPA